MAIGKNKRVSKGKKGGRKKVVDPLSRKEFYDLRAPSTFKVRNFGTTIASKNQGTKLAVDSLRHRVYEVSLADLNNDEDQAFRKIKLQCEDIQGRTCLTEFHGMDMTRDKLCSLIRKYQTLIEAHCNVKTSDGYVLRLFCIAFTRRMADQVKSTCYAQTSQIRQIRKKMVEIITSEAEGTNLRDLVKKFIPESIGKEIEKACRHIFPLQHVFIRKVKVLSKPTFDVSRLMENHAGADGAEERGTKIVSESSQATNLLTAEVKS